MTYFECQPLRMRLTIDSCLKSKASGNQQTCKCCEPTKYHGNLVEVSHELKEVPVKIRVPQNTNFCKNARREVVEQRTVMKYTPRKSISNYTIDQLVNASGVSSYSIKNYIKAKPMRDVTFNKINNALNKLNEQQKLN